MHTLIIIQIHNYFMHVVIIVGGDKMATRPIYISTGNINNPFMEDKMDWSCENMTMRKGPY